MLYSSKCAIKSVARVVQQKPVFIWKYYLVEMYCMALGASQHQVHVQSPGWMNRELMLDVDTVFFLFCFVLFTLVHFISVSFCGLALLHLEKKKRKKKQTKEKIPVVCSTFCRNRRCKCLYIVQHLYKYLPSNLSGGKYRGIWNCSIIFLCKKNK